MPTATRYSGLPCLCVRHSPRVFLRHALQRKNMKKNVLAVVATGAVGACLGIPATAEAVGFALEEQSVSNLGYAFAGGAANAEDASTIFWNPAGMTRLPGRQVVMGLNALYGSARFTDQGTTSPAGPAFPIAGGTGGNSVGLNWIPNLVRTSRLESASTRRSA